MQSHSGRSIGNVDLLFTDFNCCLCRGAACPKAWENRRNDSMGQVKNNDSFLGKAEKLKPVLKHRMLRPVGVVSFERKKADSGADFWNTVGIERLGILSVMLSDEPLAYRGIVIPLLGSYWGGSQGLSSTYEQAHVDLDLLTLASWHYLIWGSLCAMPAVSPERKSGNACFRLFSTASTICFTKSSSRSLVSR